MAATEKVIIASLRADTNSGLSLQEFLKKEFSEENILFWQACEYFSHVPATDKKQVNQKEQYRGQVPTLNNRKWLK